MTVSIAELDSRVFLGLEAVAEYLDLDKIHNAVVQKLNIRTMQSRSSDLNVLLGLSAEFTPEASPYDITSLIGKGVAAWVETKSTVLNGVDWWYPARTISLAQFNDYQRLGMFAVAFHGEEAASDTAQATQYLSFTYLPSAICRIRFDRDLTRLAMADDILLPDHFADLVVMEAQNVIIPRLKFKLTMGLRRDEEGRKDAQAILASLTEVYMQNVMDIKPFDAEWQIWSYRSRSVQTSFNKPSPSGRSMYGGSRDRFGTGGGYGGS